MKLALVTCGIYPTMEEAEQRLWIFMASAKKAGFDREDIHPYGVGRDFHRTDWRTKKLVYQLDYLKEMPDTYTHILYCDGGDGLICGSVSDILMAYKGYKQPSMVVSASDFIANDKHIWNVLGMYDGCFSTEKAYCYPHCGGYIGKREAVIEAFERMLQLPRQTYDDCWNWMDAWKEGWFRPVLDSECRIFNVGPIEVRNGHAYNPVTGTYPLVQHCTGGYADQVTWKDYKMEPLAKELGILL